jgi:hypothetical protein
MIWDIIYGTGDMQEWQFTLAYRKSAMMGGDNIPMRPPVWACSCGCLRFRKVTKDGHDAPVKLLLLANIKPNPLTDTIFEAHNVMEKPREQCHYYKVQIRTELDEIAVLSIYAAGPVDALNTAKDIVEGGNIGLKGCYCQEHRILCTE